MCVAGKKRLYDFAAQNGVAKQQTGKLIVATSEAELDTLGGLAAAARSNGVDDLRYLTPQDVYTLEPELACAGGLFSPSTGIIDSHGVVQALEGHLHAAGGSVVFNACLSAVTRRLDGIFCLEVVSGQERTHLTARNLFVAAGLGMAEIRSCLPRAQSYTPPNVYFAKGHYFTFSGRVPFRHLVYPVPVAGGLGTHLTLDLAGQARFGPDVQWIDRADYAFDGADGARQANFECSIRRYWPGLPDGSLRQGYTGIRPKTSRPGEPARDFEIHGPGDHGIPRMVTLYGIESPGLTSCLAIADYCLSLVE
jgi:L-2-hydroxyglutarate oxidase LhgO